MKFNVVTFGCKVNQYESNMMKEKMLSSGFLYEENLEKCNVIIVNTCSVTNVADKKCLKMIRKIKREDPNAILVVSGCSSQNKQEEYQNLAIDILLGNKDKSQIAKLVQEFIEKREKIIDFNNERNLEFEDMIISDFNHVRAFIKIEDGCDNFCSYCIIPFVRGSVRSKNFEKVIEEAKNLVAKGHQEIVLTGIHTGHYNDNGKDLSDLLNALAEIKDLQRIRISSIEITELNDKFLETLKNNQKICDHLHIPLQSGSEEILKRMNRKYDKEYFKNKIAKIRDIRPDISISTDIIVGHPYETEELFLECYDFAKMLEFSKIHVFPYSLREGTAAALMPNQVLESDKKSRVKRLLTLSQELEKSYFEKFVNSSKDVLIEEVSDGHSKGHTSNYLLVDLNEELEIGQIYSRVI